MPNGQPGMLAQAAQNAASVPVPGQPGAQPQPQPPAEPQLAPGEVPGPQTVSPGSAMPGQQVSMPGESMNVEGLTGPEEPASEREEAEYERVSKAMERIIYEERNLTESLMKQIDPADKIGSATKATAMLIQQLDEKIDMDEIVIPQITMDAVEKITELVEARYGIEYSEPELQATLGATWESVMAMFGVDPDDHAALQGQLDEGQMGALRGAYDGFLGGAPSAPTPEAAPAPAPAAAAGPPTPMIPGGA